VGPHPAARDSDRAVPGDHQEAGAQRGRQHPQVLQELRRGRQGRLDADFSTWLEWLRSIGELKDDSLKPADIYTNKYNELAAGGAQ